jgi:hypothetical protein
MLTWDEPTKSGHPARSSVFACYQIIRRNGAVVSFEPSEIARAMMKMFLAVRATSEFAQRTCRRWLDDLWNALIPPKGSAPVIARATACDRPFSPTSHQRQAKQPGFFGSSKPDMRNAP